MARPATKKAAPKKAAPKKAVAKTAVLTKSVTIITASEIQLLDGIPIPTKFENGRKRRYEVLTDTQPGQCVQVPAGKRTGAVAALRRHKNENPSQDWVFAVEGKYFRMWRVK